MKIFRIAFASFLAAATLNAVANPSMAKGKGYSTIKPATAHVEVGDHADDAKYEGTDDDDYSSDKYEDKDDHSAYDDKHDDKVDYSPKKSKYKVDKQDHDNHTDKSMCEETALDKNGGKTGWHNDKNDPSHYDDKDDVDHCGYYFPHEIVNKS